MKKVKMSYDATISSILEISDELYQQLQRNDFDWVECEEIFTKAVEKNKSIFYDDLRRVTNVDTEECIYEY